MTGKPLKEDINQDKQLTWKPTVNLCSLWALFPERTLPFAREELERDPPADSFWNNSATSSDWEGYGQLWGGRVQN